MHVDELPRHIEIGRLPRGEHSWAGTVGAASLPRVRDMGASTDGLTGSVTLVIDHDRPMLSGDCQAMVTLDCERCLAPVTVTAAGQFELVVVDRIEEAEGYDAGQAVGVAPRGVIDVAAVLEDELILALPLIPMHENRDCDGGQRQFGPAGEAAPVRENPFKALESLRQGDSGGLH